MAKANSTRDTRSAPGTQNEMAITEIGDIFDVAYNDCETADAIINAATILCALERAPEHHDTHPSHNLITGAGHAHGLRVAQDTLPKMLAHARYLVESAMNDFDVMREKAIDEIRSLSKGGAA